MLDINDFSHRPSTVYKGATSIYYGRNVVASIRFENGGPYGAGWSARCDEQREYLERVIRSRYFNKNGTRKYLNKQQAIDIAIKACFDLHEENEF